MMSRISFSWTAIFNIDVLKSEVIQSVLATGQWFLAADLAGLTLDKSCPTYAKVPIWDRTQWNAAMDASRIDYVLINSAAKSLLRSFEYVRHSNYSQDLGMRVTLDLKAFTSRGHVWCKTGSFPMAALDQMEDEEWDMIGRQTVLDFADNWDEARCGNQVDRAWDLPNLATETMLRVAADMAPENTFSGGRGKPPVFEKTSLPRPVTLQLVPTRIGWISMRVVYGVPCR